MIPQFIDRRCGNCGFYTGDSCAAGVTVAAVGVCGQAVVDQAPSAGDSCIYHQTHSELLATAEALQRFRCRIGIQEAL
jgi:hypothetical protein